MMTRSGELLVWGRAHKVGRVNKVGWWLGRLGMRGMEAKQVIRGG